MSESRNDEETASEARAAEEFMHKNVAYYQEFLSTWISSRMEKDKQVLTLSGLAIGLLMTFRDKLDSVGAFLIWAAANATFVSAIICILLMFGQNSDYIEKLISSDTVDSKEFELEKSLQRKTFWSFMLFIFGVGLTITLAILDSGFIITKGV